MKVKLGKVFGWSFGISGDFTHMNIWCRPYVSFMLGLWYIDIRYGKEWDKDRVISDWRGVQYEGKD